MPLRLARSRPGEPQTPETCVRERTQLTSHIIMPLTAVATDPAASRQFSRVEYNLLSPGTGQACSCGSPSCSQRVRRYSTHSLCCRDCALLRRRTPPGHGSKSCIHVRHHRQTRDGSLCTVYEPIHDKNTLIPCCGADAPTCTFSASVVNNQALSGPSQALYTKVGSCDTAGIWRWWRRRLGGGESVGGKSRRLRSRRRQRRPS